MNFPYFLQFKPEFCNKSSFTKYIYTKIVSGEAMAPHSSTLAWRIPWMEEPGRLQSVGSLRVGHDWAASLPLFTFMHWRRKWQPTPAFLPGESRGWEPGGLPSMGSHRVGHDWRDLAAAAAEMAAKVSFFFFSRWYRNFYFSLKFFFKVILSKIEASFFFKFTMLFYFYILMKFLLKYSWFTRLG